MTYAQKFEHTDDSGDTFYASHTTWTRDDDDTPSTTPDEHIALRTRGGRPVYLPMRVARELAGWLIEHAVEPQCPETYPGGRRCTRPAGHDGGHPESPRMVSHSAGAGGAGGVAYGGAGGMAAYGGQGGAGGSATIVQRTV